MQLEILTKSKQKLSFHHDIRYIVGVPPTSLYDVAKWNVRVLVGGGTVPPLMPELVLALRYAASSTRTHALDGVGVALTYRDLKGKCKNDIKIFTMVLII